MALAFPYGRKAWGNVGATRNSGPAFGRGSHTPSDMSQTEPPNTHPSPRIVLGLATTQGVPTQPTHTEGGTLRRTKNHPLTPSPSHHGITLRARIGAVTTIAALAPRRQLRQLARPAPATATSAANGPSQCGPPMAPNSWSGQRKTWREGSSTTRGRSGERKSFLLGPRGVAR